MSIKANLPKLWLSRIWLGIFLLLATNLVWAQALPWAKPLDNIKESLTGPVAKAIGVIALSAAGGMLAFGGELGDFTKRILMIVMALSVLLLANNVIEMITSQG